MVSPSAFLFKESARASAAFLEDTLGTARRDERRPFETVRWVRRNEGILSGKMSPDYLRVKREKTRVIGDDGHFGAILARLVKHAIL